MANLQDFTSTSQVRAVLGVSQEELEDATIELPLYVGQLRFTLADVDAGLEADYAALVAQPTRTAPEQTAVDAVQIFSAYAIAKTLLTSLSLFAPQRVLDDRAEMHRVSDPFADARAGVIAGFDVAKARLLQAYAVITGVPAVAVARKYFAAAGLCPDPVTNR